MSLATPGSAPARPRPLMLIVMDGWGIGDPASTCNATTCAPTPNLRRLYAEYPSTRLQASGEAVGLLPGQMGDSNVGHLNLGAGRIVWQNLPRIDRAIRTGEFQRNPALTEAIGRAAPQAALHLLGLVSDGGVHSHIRHLYALIDMAAKAGVRSVFVHVFLDGRDVPPKSALEWVPALEAELSRRGIGRVATVMGRFYAMDRDKRWDRVEKAYRAMVAGDGERTAPTAEAAIHTAYEAGETDEFVAPTVIKSFDMVGAAPSAARTLCRAEPDCAGGCGTPAPTPPANAAVADASAGRPDARILPGDSVIFVNFRADRAREICHALVDTDFTGFVRPGVAGVPAGGPPGVHLAAMAEYDTTLGVPVAFPPQELRLTLGELLSSLGLTQLRVAETEKYAHVTFFFSGGREEPFPGEDRVLVPSPKVATYDLKPEMSAPEVTSKVLEAIASRTYDFILLNYANPDMVGHTGVWEAALKAVETVDDCLGQVVGACLSAGGVALVTADHGNIEKMREDDGEPHTAHTSDDVPFLLIDPTRRNARLRDEGILADVAPTILTILKISRPPEMTGRPLFVEA